MDEDILKKAVELADGWALYPAHGTTSFLLHCGAKLLYQSPIEELPQWALDALAAQLARQYHERRPEDRLFYEDDAMDVLKYVVKSKVLETK